MIRSPESYRQALVSKQVSIAPIVSFRILFGALMLFSTLRFLYNGWLTEFYIQPSFHFTYLGFDWIAPLSEPGMYFLFGVLLVSSIGIMLGALYRISALLFFLSFTYVELLDKTYYLNHYYFVSIIALLMVFIPANARFSLDVAWHRVIRKDYVPVLYVNLIKFQLFVVYFYAGIAKINADWLLEALPLKIWLPAHAYWPVVGDMFNELWVAYAFSWAGMLYDVSVPFLLLNKKTRIPAYAAVVVFHILTRLLFPIGVFPYVMIASTLIFFSANFHIRMLNFFFFGKFAGRETPQAALPPAVFPKYKGVFVLVGVFAIMQLVIPFRHMLYPGNLFWHEQGYRFSWRVMLTEKVGNCQFWVEDPEGNISVVDNRNHLTVLQERMMATQPDMILQYAHHLDEIYRKKGITDPQVFAECIVSLQGQRSRPFIDREIDLSKQQRGFKNKEWILEHE